MTRRARPGPARPGRYHLPRPRLDAMLDEALDVSLVLVSAPAGSGKTEAVAGWLARCDVPAGWLAVGPGHNDPSLFWPALAAALDVAGAARARGPQQVVDALGEEPDRPRVVVLDDYHLIVNTVIHAGLDALLGEAAPPLHVVLGSRHDPPLRLSSLRAAGLLREVRFQELRFDDGEVAGWLNGVLGLDLPAADLDRLRVRTEGWVVGLQLAALALQRQPDRAAFVSQFAGDDRHVADYVRDEVVASLPDDLRRFLLDTAVLDRLTAPLCEAVTGVPDAQVRLDELERMNLFLTPLDHRRRWYRYHHLFAEWLRLGPVPEDAGQRHRRAADWLAAHRLPGDAIHHYLAAGDPERAADLIEGQRWRLVGQGRQYTLRDWIDRLPEPVFRRRPRLILARAWVAYHEGHWDDVRDLVGRFGEAARPAAEPDAALLQAETALLTAGRLAALGELAQAGTVAGAALELVAEHEPRARTGLLLVLGKARLGEDDLDGARRAFVDAERLARGSGVTVVELIARSHLAEIARRRGQRHQAEKAAREALALADGAGLADHPECAVPHLVLGTVLVELGRVEQGAWHIQRGSELTERIPYQPRAWLAAAARACLATARTRGRAATSAEAITPRERAVLRLLPTQLTAREIASELYVSLNTVKSHTGSLYRKLGVRTRHAAIERAREQHLL